MWGLQVPRCWMIPELEMNPGSENQGGHVRMLVHRWDQKEVWKEGQRVPGRSNSTGKHSSQSFPSEACESSPAKELQGKAQVVCARKWGLVGNMRLHIAKGLSSELPMTPHSASSPRRRVPRSHFSFPQTFNLVMSNSTVSWGLTEFYWKRLHEALILKNSKSNSMTLCWRYKTTSELLTTYLHKLGSATDTQNCS